MLPYVISLLNFKSFERNKACSACAPDRQKLTKMKSHLKEYINRWRHTRGYGVHSPLAFRIVKDCIMPDSRYGFYSDAYLDFEYHEDRKGLRNARMAIRLVNLLRPKRIWYPNGDKRLCTALKMSFPKIYLATQKVCPKNIDFIISPEPSDFWSKMDGMEECGMLVFAEMEESKTNDFFNPPTLSLYGRNFTILLRRIGMERISYSF